ncbi:hypothetical protein KKI24_26965 [bacterium]|nr:hypothetical protein [bacterium]
MQKKQLIIPHYCESCQHLTFFLREGEPEQFYQLDYMKGVWKPHSCSQIYPGLTETISKRNALSEIDWAPQNIAFKHQPGSQSKKRVPLTMGIVLNVTVKDESLLVDVITPENQLLNVKVLGTEPKISAGSAISLKKAVRIGKDKFRLESIDFINPGKKTAHKQPAVSSCYQLILKAKDQEKLETFINRLVTSCNKNRTLPINIVPLPIEHIDGEQIFNREMNLPLETDLLRKIEKITVPESVQVTVRQS